MREPTARILGSAGWQAASHPPSLLSSKRFQKFLEEVRRRFDWVIVDSPPVMAVTDASILAHLASGVLFVAAADVTNRPAAVRAMEQLAAAKANLIGAVLNRADVERNAYFYSPYYRSEYRDYYTTATTPAARTIPTAGDAGERHITVP